MSIFDETSKIKNLPADQLSINFKDELSALKKVNQFGKKLSDGKYIMYNGMLFGYDAGNSISVGFMDPKHINALSPLMPFIIEIDGECLYKASKDYNFVGYKKHKNSIELIFEHEVMVTEEFDIEKFIEYGKYKGYSEFDIIVAYKKGWETNMEIYNLYIQYVRTLVAVKKNIIDKVYLNIVDTTNKIYSKVTSIMYDIRRYGKLKASKNFNDDELLEFNNTDEPTDLEFIDEDTGNKITIRVMKNVFKTMSSKSKIGIRVIDVGERHDYLVTNVDTTGTLVCNIFKIIT